MMSYTETQLKKLKPDKYGIQIKIKTTEGETKWMTPDAIALKTIIFFLISYMMELIGGSKDV